MRRVDVLNQSRNVAHQKFTAWVIVRRNPTAQFLRPSLQPYSANTPSHLEASHHGPPWSWSWTDMISSPRREGKLQSVGFSYLFYMTSTKWQNLSCFSF